MQINGEKVIGYNRSCDMGLTVFTKRPDHNASEATQVFMSFESKADCDAYAAIVHAQYLRCEAELHAQYIFVSQGIK